MSLATLKKIILGLLNAAVRIGILIFVCSLIKKVCITSYDYGYRVFSETPITQGEGIEKDIIIPIGSSSRDIGTILMNNGLIRDDKLFIIQELLSSYRGKLQPGNYTLNTSMTAEEMMKIMAGSDKEEDEEDSEENAQPAEGSSDVTADAMSESGAVDLDVSGIDTEEGGEEAMQEVSPEGTESTENAE